MEPTPQTSSPIFSRRAMLAWAIIIGLTLMAILNWKDVKNGFQDGWNDATGQDNRPRQEAQ